LARLGLAVGLGAGSLILNNRVAYEVLRWAGALYLCWLAYDSWKDARQPVETVSVSKSLFVQFRLKAWHFRNGLNSEAGAGDREVSFAPKSGYFLRTATSGQS
jgi:threonine/homoserine/homoserine lactone efflux protein